MDPINLEVVPSINGYKNVYLGNLRIAHIWPDGKGVRVATMGEYNDFQAMSEQEAIQTLKEYILKIR